MADLLALTLWPEWAWAICNLDKRVENRNPRFAEQIARRVGDGWLAIHAGQSIGGRSGAVATSEGLWAVKDMALRWGWDCYSHPGIFDLVPATDLDATPIRLSADTVGRSAVVAVARIGGIIRPGVGAAWKVRESAALQLSGVVVLPQPVPCRGQQGLWRLGTDLAVAVLAQLEQQEVPRA